MFCHEITTACLAFAFLITRFRFLVTVYSKGKKMDIHISVNITIRNMFMSCRQVALSKLTETVDIDKFGGILTCVYFKSCLVF